MAQFVTRGRVAALTVLCTLWSLRAAAQQRDTTVPPRPTDSLRVYTLPPTVVSVTRANPPINRIPQAVHLLEQTEISRARPTWGLDEALVTVPGVYAANRYNFSLDQRISIRGFGARSAFAVRGIKVLVDGIPQTLPDGQGQLTNLELGAAFARGAWLEVEETHSSGYVVNDTLNTSTSPWWTTNVRLGWDGTVGSLRLRPFVGFNNVWNRFYVASVVINAANGRYYEPAPGRNMYVGFSLGAGE